MPDRFDGWGVELTYHSFKQTVANQNSRNHVSSNPTSSQRLKLSRYLPCSSVNLTANFNRRIRNHVGDKSISVFCGLATTQARPTVSKVKPVGTGRQASDKEFLYFHVNREDGGVGAEPYLYRDSLVIARQSNTFTQRIDDLVVVIEQFAEQVGEVHASPTHTLPESVVDR